MRCISSFAEIAVGFLNKTVTVFQSDGLAQLTVAISFPRGAVSIEISLVLLVSTLDGTATGLSQRSRLEFDFTYVIKHLFDTQTRKF